MSYMRVYGEPIRVKEILLDMGFLPSEIGKSGKDDQYTYVIAKRPDDTAIANLRAKPGIVGVKVFTGEMMQVFCRRSE